MQNRSTSGAKGRTCGNLSRTCGSHCRTCGKMANRWASTLQKPHVRGLNAARAGGVLHVREILAARAAQGRKVGMLRFACWVL